jgi:hypothetical protein
MAARMPVDPDEATTGDRELARKTTILRVARGPDHTCFNCLGARGMAGPRRRVCTQSTEVGRANLVHSLGHRHVDALVTEGAMGKTRRHAVPDLVLMKMPRIVAAGSSGGWWWAVA